MPVSAPLIELIEGPIVLFCGVNSEILNFNDVCGMDQEAAVCDIDASYTNMIEMPTLPDEYALASTLQSIKNPDLI